MTKDKIGVLLVNLGTPDSPSVANVRKYLREFLSDRRVIDIPNLSRFLLVNGIIVPFRSPKSAKLYKELWTERGSPLLFYGKSLREMLQKSLGTEYRVVLGMRYQSPSIEAALCELINKYWVSKIIVIPLFPQYASATTGSIHEKVMKLVKKRQVIPEIHFVSKFIQHPLFIKAFTERGKEKMLNQDYEHFVFSYHGLPERQIKKASSGNYCQLSDSCCAEYGINNQYCYRAQCVETTRLLVAELGVPPEKCTTCFQSRLGKNPWIRPYAEDIIKELAERGVKKVLAFSPAFVADCLETIIEVGEEFRDEFMRQGGEKWTLVESLNDSSLWVACLKDLVCKNSGY